MASSNGNIFRVTGPLWKESTGDRWIPLTNASNAELLMYSLICSWINGWVTNGEAGDLRRHRTHYDVTVMSYIVNTMSAKDLVMQEARSTTAVVLTTFVLNTPVSAPEKE